MNHLTCDMCRDLIPLVLDHVASQDSEQAVLEHITQCPQCEKIFCNGERKTTAMDETRVVKKMKNQLYFMGLVTVAVGILVGIGLSDSSGVFYNVALMPTVGVVGYFTLKRKVYYLPAALFVLSYLWGLINLLFDGGASRMGWTELLTVPIFWPVIYTAFCLLGILIGSLLHIAFRKEERK